MRSIQRFLLGLSLMATLCGLLGNATPALACSCAEATPAEQFENATTIFVGTVKNISEDGGRKSVYFDVSESRKGSVAGNATVTTGWGDADCGFNFEEDKKYVVYSRSQGQLDTNICIGTSLLVSDVQDGDGENNVTNSSETPITEPNDEDDSLAPFAIVALVSFGAGALVTYLAGRKNK